MRRVLFAFTGIAAAVFIMAIGGVDNVVRSQSSLPAPTGVSAANADNHGEAVVSWQAVADAAYYRIGWMADEDYQAALLEPNQEWAKEFRYSNVVNRGQTSHTITRLTPGIKYWIIVGSHDAFYGAPQWSSWAEVTLVAAPTTGVQPGQGGTPLPSSTFVSSASKYQAVDAGKNHTCGIKLDNTLECWGDNTQGQTNAPEGQFLSVSAGGVYSCGINFENQLACWGHAAIPSPPDGDFTHVSVGDNHACAITAAVGNPNRIRCWGLPNSDGRSANQAENKFGRNGTWQSVSAGSDYSCALYRSPGRGSILDCWGNNSGDYRRFDSVGALKAISTGSVHICGLYRNSHVACHGNDVHGQLTGRPSAQDEGAADDFYTYSAVSAGERHSCGLRTTGNIRCWGDDLRGQATPPGGNDELRANEEGVGDFTAVSAGDSHTCGLRRDGTVVCWGLNDHSQATPR